MLSIVVSNSPSGKYLSNRFVAKRSPPTNSFLTPPPLFLDKLVGGAAKKLKKVGVRVSFVKKHFGFFSFLHVGMKCLRVWVFKSFSLFYPREKE